MYIYIYMMMIRLYVSISVNFPRPHVDLVRYASLTTAWEDGVRGIIGYMLHAYRGEPRMHG